MKHKKTIIHFLYVLSLCIAFYILFATDIESSFPAWKVSLFYLCFCAWRYHIIKLDDKKNLYEKVAWIAKRRSYGAFNSTHLRDFDLIDYIGVEQREHNIPQQYYIDFSNETEKELLKQILGKHKEYVIERYFLGYLKESKEIYKLKSLEYYFLSLHCFISNNNDNNVYSKREPISVHQYKCKLTDYGKAYYKLALITQLYIESNENVYQLCEYRDKKRINNIMEILDKNEVCFFS